MEGKNISHYSILERLGAGGMGVVYKAEDNKLRRPVALKFLGAELAHDEEARERFVQEAQTVSGLDHPNICAVHEIDEVDGQVFIAMGYYEGETLQERLLRGPIPVDEALDITAQVTRGLREAHAAGVVHRDIKPANVILTKNNVAKILDFGIAKLLDVTSITRDGKSFGTLSYMSPEQVSGEGAEQRSDLWAVGAMLYEMVSGTKCFKGDNQAAIVNAIVNVTPVPLTTISEEITQQIEDLVARALTRSRGQRFQSADELLSALEACRGIPNDLVGDQTQSRPALSMRSAVAAAIVGLVVVGAGYALIGDDPNVVWAREEAIPEITRLIEMDNYTEAFSLVAEAQLYIPSDPMLSDLLSRITVPVAITSTPEGAAVYLRPYDDILAEWEYLGETPLEDVAVSRGLHRLRLEGNEFETVEVSFNSLRAGIHLDLPSKGTLEEGLVPVPGATVGLTLSGFNYQLLSASVPAYQIGKYEVTNEEFKRFVDAGGYENESFWEHEFIDETQSLTWSDAMQSFRDSTGRPGPSTWQGGSYLEGQEKWPVTGVSWFEAAAYASFVGQDLPSAYHWVLAAGTFMAAPVIAQSNFSNEGLNAVGVSPGLSRFGSYDMAGNAREWIWNEVSSRKIRYILGGAWSDPSYKYVEAAGLSPFDRSGLNGFRCVKYDSRAVVADTLVPIPLPNRDFKNEQVASDEIFNIYRANYSYDATELNPVVEEVPADSQYWTRERVTIDTAYGDGRFAVNLFLPASVQPPYQTVVVFPGANAISTAVFEDYPIGNYDYLVMSGRAVAFPVYDQTFERNTGRVMSYPDDSTTNRDWVIRTAKDMMRAVDYLETRNDVDIGKLAYQGTSWGGRMGPLALSLDDRFSAGILRIAGLTLAHPAPEVDPFHFAPRVTVPVLMLNGDDDIVFPVESAQLPLYQSLGTLGEHKKHILYDGGHGVVSTYRNQMMTESLAWLDQYLGSVN